MASVQINGDVLAMLEQLESEGLDTWELAVTAGGGTAQNAGDHTGQSVTPLSWWRLGDLACHVAKRYGANRIAEYAKAVNEPVEHVKTARRVARFFNRAMFPRDGIVSQFNNLSLSHFKYALAFKDPDIALIYLEACDNLALTCEAARIQMNRLTGKKVPPEKLLDAEGRIARTYEQEDGFYIVYRVEPGVDVAKLQEKKGAVRRIVAYAAEVEESA